ncbi:MAG: lipopolysaccharide biosynthesis protein [Promethearchaeota archaeon]
MTDSGEKPDPNDTEWREVGFHRPLGGFWFNYTLILGSAVFAVVFMLWVMPNYILPFPEAIGFQTLIANLFSVYFTLADVGVGRAITRFVAEDNVKSPRKSIQYLQFFVWYQMLSGLGQVTVIAFWALYVLPASGLAYAAWFVIVYSTIQFPGMLGVFTGALEGFQRFDKANLVKFVQTVVFENTTRVACILLGRYFGRMNPAVGELVGATIGSIVGAYIDDFVAAIFGAHLIRPVLKEIDPSWGVRDVFRIDFDWALVKRCLWFGIRAQLPSVVYQGTNFLLVFLLFTYLPNYSTVWGLYSLALTVGNLASSLRFQLVSTLSEAYNNEKHALTQNYITRAYRWWGIIEGLIGTVIFAGAPLLGIVAGENYAGMVPMIQVLVVTHIPHMTIVITDDINYGCNKPHYNIAFLACEQATRLTLTFLFLTGTNLGWVGVAVAQGVAFVVKFVVSYAVINSRIVKMRINPWQSVVAPVVAALSMYGVIQLVLWLGFPPLASLLGATVAAMLLIIAALLFLPLLVFFPVYALMGGWDDASLAIFEKAVRLSGPSRPIVSFVLRVTRKIARVTPLHNRFAIPQEAADREIAELMLQRERELAAG